MKVESLIPTVWFCKEDNEKNKLNWFTYELACKFYENIDESRKKAVTGWKAQKSDEQIANFCAYFAKRVKRGIIDISNGVRTGVQIDEAFIRDYYHMITRSESNAILEIAGSSYGDLLETCVICPTKCLEEMYMYCYLFDE
jgi:hypothetical protein